MTLFRKAPPPPELEEEGFRLADEWVEVDTSLSILEYIYYHASPKLKEWIDEMDRINNASTEGGTMRRKRKLTKKVLEARMQDIMNEPTPEDEERLQQIKERAFEEYKLREKARAIIEQQKPQKMLMLDRESRKEEIARILAEWDKESD